MRLESVSSQCESFDRLPQALQTFPGLKTAGLRMEKLQRQTVQLSERLAPLSITRVHLSPPETPRTSGHHGTERHQCLGEVFRAVNLDFCTADCFCGHDFYVVSWDFLSG